MQAKAVANAPATTAEQKTSSGDRNADKPVESNKSGKSLYKVNMRASRSRAYLLADPQSNDAMALCLSLGLEMKLIQATDDLDLTAEIKSLRGFNTRQLGCTPEVQVEDFLQPVEMRVTLEQGSLQRTGKVEITNVLLRTGFNNVYLVQRALQSLSPPPTPNEESETKVSETKVSERARSEQKNSEREPEQLSSATSIESSEKQQEPSAITQNFVVHLPLLTLYVLNDRGSMELPLLQLRMHQISATYSSLDNQWDDYTGNIVDCLRAAASMSVAVDSYNETVTLWEPVVEPWAMKLEARQGPDPQKRLEKYGNMNKHGGNQLSAREWHRLRQKDPKCAHIQNAMKITISTEDVLELNLTIPFINLCLDLQNMMKQTDVEFTDEGYYTHIENQLGKEIVVETDCAKAMSLVQPTGESGLRSQRVRGKIRL